MGRRFITPGSNLGFIKAGIDLETAYVHELRQKVRMRNDCIMQSQLGTDADKLEGTDFHFNGACVDVTCNPDKGGKIKWLSGESDPIDRASVPVTVHYGIRYHNGRKYLARPVLVVAVDCASTSWLSKNMMFLTESLTTKKMIDKLIRIIDDIIFDAEDDPGKYGIKLA